MLDGQNTIKCTCCGQPVEGVSVLIDEASGMISSPTKCVRFTPMQFRAARVLIEKFPNMATKEYIYDTAIADDNGDGPEIKIVDVVICKIRPLLADVGLLVETVWGKGYRIVEGEASQGTALKDASIRLRGKGIMNTWKPGYDEWLLDLMDRKHSITSCANVMKLPYMAVERAVKRLRSEPAI